MSEVNKPQIVQIRKKGGLEKIVRDVNSGAKVNPMLYTASSKSREEDGILEGEYKGKTIIGTKHFIAPHYIDLKKRWGFDGSVQKLSELIGKMKLRYPKGHPQEGQMIKSNGDKDIERLTNRQDDIFNHPDFYGKYFMESGRVSLDLSDPKQEFLYLCYRGDTATEDKSSDEKVSKYFSAGAKYQLISPKKETQAKKRDADKEVEAIKLLAAMDGNEDRMRAVAVVMQLPGYAPTTDANGLFILLKDLGAQNTEFGARYNKSYQDRFIELAKMDDDELNVTSQVIMAKERGFLRKRQGFYLFNGERLDGLDNELQLLNYFKSPKNQEDYIKLTQLLESDGRIK